MKKIILALVIVVIVVVAGVWYWDHQRQQTLSEFGKMNGYSLTGVPGGMTKKEAKAIAEKNCIKGGESIGRAYYNINSKTWWFDANLNATEKGCNPACVVSEETKQVEINWRCTGYLGD